MEELTVLKDSNFTLKDRVTIMFTNNSAQYGGAIFLDTTATMVNNSDGECLYFKTMLLEFQVTKFTTVVEFKQQLPKQQNQYWYSTPPKQLNLMIQQYALIM